jgi:hypothetical protein
LNGVCYGQRTFYIVGDGVTLQSGVFPEPTRLLPQSPTYLSDGEIRFRIESQPGAELVIESSTDLSAWNTIITVTNVSGVIEFKDATPRGLTSRFYRAKQAVP